ncbi:MAG: NADH-quinone oxidoreductase subunit N [Verrucomicrobia bacterium]|nr:NADH-quinone oxidoreductase subunit N [Verrucomicrobiota bacterium]
MNYNALFIQLLPETVLVITALLLLGVAVAVEAKTNRPLAIDVTIAISALGIAGACAALYYIPPNYASGTALLVMDPLARLFKAVVLGLGLLAVLLPPARNEIGQPGEFHALLLFALTGLLLTVGTTHLLFLFVALELASLSLYLLAGFSRTAKAAEAALKYFLFGGVSAAFFLFGLSLLYGFCHPLTLSAMAAALNAGPLPPFAVVGLVMVVVGLGFKLAAVPFHYWAPDVYQGAPATSVAVVAAASKAVGVLVLVRLLMMGFEVVAGSAAWGAMKPGWSLWLGALAAVSMVFGNVLALAQSSVRRLLAYSAVANTGYLLVALAANGTTSSGAALFYVVVYGLATFGALAVTAAVERDRGDDSLGSFAGLVQRSPLQAVALLVFLTSLAGLPPLAGFVGKFAMFSAAMAESTTHGIPGLTWLVGLAAIMSAISLYYYLMVLKQALVREAADSAALALPMSHRLAMTVPAVLLIALGLFPALLLSPLTAALAATLRGQ